MRNERYASVLRRVAQEIGGLKRSAARCAQAPPQRRAPPSP
jgi:hypothetical protein